MSASTLPFAHLHCHSHYSLLDGAGSIDRLVERAKGHGMNALALTDHGNLHGALEFYRKAKAAGHQPDHRLRGLHRPRQPPRQKTPAASKEASYHLTLLCQNRTGFQNLLKLASAAFLEGFYFKPRIDKELLAAHNEGLICLSGCVSSEFNRALLKGHGGEEHLAEAAEVARWFQQLFGDRYFIEIRTTASRSSGWRWRAAVDVARRLGIPLVATSDVHYVDREDAEAQDMLLCINTGKFRTDTQPACGWTATSSTSAARRRCTPPSRAWRTPSRAARRSPTRSTSTWSWASGISPSIRRCRTGKTAEEFLRELCLEGLQERYADDAEMCPDGELSAGGHGPARPRAAT